MRVACWILYQSGRSECSVRGQSAPDPDGSRALDRHPLPGGDWCGFLLSPAEGVKQAWRSVILISTLDCRYPAGTDLADCRSVRISNVVWQTRHGDTVPGFVVHFESIRLSTHPESPPMTDPAEVLQIDDKERAARLVDACQKIREQVGLVVVGQDEVIEQLLIAILARGHCLLEGVPGLAKTLMVRSLAQSMNLSFHRIQFTPDLMPADITGTDIIQENRETGHRDLVFDKGPIFTQMLLADEINRTPPKTQAALLEAMQEHEVTVGGTTYRLDEPFFVLATQNPIEQEGTYPLPEAQRDRFLFNVIVDYPSRDQEGEIIDRTTSTLSTELQAVVAGEEIIDCQQTVRLVPLPDHVKNFVLDLVRSARPGDPATARLGS